MCPHSTVSASGPGGLARRRYSQLVERTWTSNGRLRTSVLALAALVLPAVSPAVISGLPAGAAEEPGRVIVQITRLAPAVLDANDDVTDPGLVRTPEPHGGTNLTVYPPRAKKPLLPPPPPP